MRTIILFARAPQLGRVKTRLARDIGDAAALGLYVAMLRDTLAKAEQLAREIGGGCVLAYTPRGAMEAAQDGAPSLGDLWSGESWAQPEGDLGVRMHAAIEWAFGRGASAVALLGADVPDMDVRILARDFGGLRRQAESLDVILEPARDDGFWTLACNRTLPRGAFDLDWSQGATREPLRASLESHGLRVAVGPSEGDDVDDVAALRRLGERLREDASRAARTAEWMRANGWW